MYDIQGSPPRMRGKRESLTMVKYEIGITPADAGKTSTDTLRNLRTRDHPRGCGENTGSIAQNKPQ